MGDSIDVEGLSVALTVFEAGQSHLDERKTKSREATSGRLFWQACGIKGPHDTRRPLPRISRGRGHG